MRQHLVVLDGLRGVAAISVMLFHRRDWFGGDAFMGHAFLAVDFFFMLSGFVLAHAYEARLQRQGSFLPFVRDRIMRLHPMLVVGAVLALAVALADARASESSLLHLAPLTFLASLVPAPAPWAGAPSAYPWNIALWSLTWELLANFLYAAVARRLSNAVLASIIFVAVAAMVGVSATHQGFQVGFANDLGQFLWGFPRVCASFFIGVAIRRLPLSARVPLHRQGWFCAATLVVTFLAVPLHAPVSAVYDPVIAFLVYPWILVLGASAEPVIPRLAAMLGAVSYPLYVIHEPALRLVGGIFSALHIGTRPPSLAEAMIRFAVIIAFALILLKVYDEPVRRWLKRSPNA